jgi:hypothetical protein
MRQNPYLAGLTSSVVVEPMVRVSVSVSVVGGGRLVFCEAEYSDDVIVFELKTKEIG